MKIFLFINKNCTIENCDLQNVQVQISTHKFEYKVNTEVEYDCADVHSLHIF